MCFTHPDLSVPITRTRSRWTVTIAVPAGIRQHAATCQVEAALNVVLIGDEAACVRPHILLYMWTTKEPFTHFKSLFFETMELL